MIWPTAENAELVMKALKASGAPVKQHGVTPADFTARGKVYQLRLPPRRIDLMTRLSGVDFDDAWSTRVVIEIDDMSIPFLALDALRRNRQATGRDKDLLDVRFLDGTESGG